MIVKNKYLNALLILMLLSATMHMLILSFLAITQKKIFVLNYFNILDLDILFPSLFKDNLTGNALSFAVAAGIYFFIFYLANKKLSGKS